jgi:hypothetical protein
MAYLTNREAPNSGLANLLAMKGRMGDTELVHMSKPEIDMMERMGKMTSNPMTGLPEAFSLEDEITGLASLMNMPSAKTAMNDLMEFGKEKLKTLNMKELQKEMPPMPPPPQQQQIPIQMPMPQPQQGGMAMMAGGMRPKDYFEGQVYDDRGDGMTDSINFKVEGDPVIKGAKLSADEYVLPADLVAMLGNGSSDAGAEKLDKFTKEMRVKAFGTPKQQRKINATKELRDMV